MDPFDLSEDERALVRLVREVAAAEIAPHAGAYEQGTASVRAGFDVLARLGLCGVPWPENAGGQGLGLHALLVCLEELAAASGAVALAFAAHTAWAGAALARAAPGALRDRLLPALCTGERLATLASIEAAEGEFGNDLQTRARAESDRWRLAGEKRLVPFGREAALRIVTARADGDERPALFVVEGRPAGLDCTPVETTLGMQGLPFANLTFTALSLDEDCRLAAPAGRDPSARSELAPDLIRGQALWRETVTTMLLATAALAVGLARAAHEAADEYARQRRQFQRPLREFAAMRARLADMAVRVETGRRLARDGARRFDAGRPAYRAALMAKIAASEAAVGVCWEAMQVFGGYGYIKEFPVERRWRDAQFCEAAPVANDVLRLALADAPAAEASA